MSNVLSVSSKGPIILIDGSYFVFHRFYATLKWYKFRNESIKVSNCMDTIEFTDAIKKHTIANIEKLRKKWANIKEGAKRKIRKDWEGVPVWFAIDCKRSNIWRTNIVNDYKATRDQNSERDDFDSRVFDIIYSLLKDSIGISMLEIESLEADDIVALTHKRLRSDGYIGKIICITNDNDYLQLCDENTELYNLDEKNIATRGCGNARKDLLSKILVGDKSDNIKPVRSKLNEKKLKDILHLTEEEILDSLHLNDSEKKLFDMNRTLIDFSYIPECLVDKYNMTYSIKFL